MKTILSFLVLLFCGFNYAQTTVSGTVTDKNGQPIPGTNVIIVGTATGTISDFDGKFNLTVDQSPPFNIQASNVGFESKTLAVTSANQTLNFVLDEGTELDEVVLSASRTPERVFESPVTIERFGLKDIKTTASATFYDGLENLKGVDINTNSLTFKSINTRGFATFANTRFMQLVDGMDNSAPALNFPLGNLLGMSELDVQSVELLPGAASALYGANAFNGILFMRSKSPFDNAGISAYFKQGITSQEAAGDNPFSDWGIRLAHKFSDKFAAKINFSHLNGTDWFASNEDDKRFNGFTRDNPDYDGVNIYGDEVSTNIFAASGGSGLIPNNQVVSRTGYREQDLTNYDARSVKADWGLYYRPWGTDFEIQYLGKVGTGSTVYQGTNRYSIKEFFLQQHKLEIRNDNFFVRGYITEDDAGDSYDMVFTGININRAWKSDTDWFGDYIRTFIGAVTTGNFTEEQAHAAARAKADEGRFLPGTPEFESAFNRVTNDADLTSGSKFQDNSKIYHADGNYNFSHLIDFADIQVGGSYRKYSLNSFGTIYTDADGKIDYSEVGVYTQIQKDIQLNEAMSLKLTGSVRYDKSELFDAFFSPRVSAGLSINRNHNIRASFQTGFRNPTTQDLFIGLDAGRAVLIGSATSNLDRDRRTYSVSALGQGLGQPATVEVLGRAAYENSFTASSVQAGTFQKSDVTLVEPEQVTSFEVGYRAKVSRFIIDLSGYYNSYEDFISNEDVVVPFYGTVGDNTLSLAALGNGDFKAYRTYTNSKADVNSFGGSIGVSTKLGDLFDVSASYTYAEQDFDDEQFPDFKTFFNTPQHKAKASFGGTDVVDNLGFNVSWRWSDDYFWEATFGDGPIPAYHNLDAQLNYTLPKLKSTFKVGATNLLNDEYYTAIGTGFIGSQYYVSWTINNL